MGAGGEERFEQMRLLVRRHAGAVVPDFERRQLAVGLDKQLEPGLRQVVIQGAMAPGIAQQIVENLSQLIRVHQGFEVARADVQVNQLAIGRAFTGFGDEMLQPRLQIEPLRYGLLAAGQLQDVFDDSVHALGMVLNNLRQTPIRAVQFLGFLQ